MEKYYQYYKIFVVKETFEILCAKKQSEILNQIASIVDSLTAFTVDESLRSGIVYCCEDLRK